MVFGGGGICHLDLLFVFGGPTSEKFLKISFFGLGYAFLRDFLAALDDGGPGSAFG